MRADTCGDGNERAQFSMTTTHRYPPPPHPPHRDGTPGGQAVSELFQVDWATVLVSSFGTVVVRFDGRGSGFRGSYLLHKVQRKLGVFEEKDQLEALRCVQGLKIEAQLQSLDQLI